jgi:hypothetical protein
MSTPQPFSFQGMTINEWRLWNDREDVILRSQTALGVYDAYPLVASDGNGAAKRRAISWKEMTASAGAYTNQDKAWLIPSSNLPDGVLPKPGDQVRDALDVDWTVGDVTVGKFGNTYKCVSRSLALVHELTASGQLTRPDNTQDGAGRMAEVNYTAIGGPVRCRVQPQDSQAGDAFDRRTMLLQFSAFLETPLTVRARDVFTVTTYASYGGAVTGVTAYTVKGFKNAAKIWDIMSLDLELIS